MYESPVSVTIRRVIEDSKNAIESIVCNAAFEMGIEIDKGELLKALMYDRDQYNNGYADGKADATSKWISVEDRLPESDDEKSDCYLVTDGEFIWMAYYACKEWQFAQCTDSPYVIDWTDITHWMPLPESPKEAIT